MERYVLSRTGTPERERARVEEVSGNGCARIFKGKAGWGYGLKEVIAGSHIGISVGLWHEAGSQNSYED